MDQGNQQSLENHSPDFSSQEIISDVEVHFPVSSGMKNTSFKKYKVTFCSNGKS